MNYAAFLHHCQKVRTRNKWGLHFSNCKDLRLWEDLVPQGTDEVKSPQTGRYNFKAVGMTPETQDITWKFNFSVVTGLVSHL